MGWGTEGAETAPPGRGPGLLQLGQAAAVPSLGSAAGVPRPGVGQEPGRRGALQPQEPHRPPGVRDPETPRDTYSPGVTAARTRGSGRGARKVALGSTVHFLGESWRQPCSAGNTQTGAFASSLTRPSFPPVQELCPLLSSAHPSPVSLLPFLSPQLPSIFMLSISPSLSPAGFKCVLPLCIDSPNFHLWPLSYLASGVSGAGKQNPLGTLDWTCPRLSPTSHQLQGLPLSIFYEACPENASPLPRPGLSPYPGSFHFDICCCHSHFHFPRPDLHLSSLAGFWKPPLVGVHLQAL